MKNLIWMTYHTGFHLLGAAERVVVGDQVAGLHTTRHGSSVQRPCDSLLNTPEMGFRYHPADKGLVIRETTLTTALIIPPCAPGSSTRNEIERLRSNYHQQEMPTVEQDQGQLRYPYGAFLDFIHENR